MKRTALTIGLAALVTGCAAVAAGWDWLIELGDSMRETGFIDYVVEAYSGLVMAHGEPGSDLDALRLLEQATGLVFDRREELRGIGQQAIDAALGMAGLLGFQGVASGRGRQLWATLIGSLVRGQVGRVAATGASLIGAAHSGRVLGAEKVLAVVPQPHAASAPDEPESPAPA